MKMKSRMIGKSSGILVAIVMVFIMGTVSSLIPARTVLAYESLINQVLTTTAKDLGWNTEVEYDEMEEDGIKVGSWVIYGPGEYEVGVISYPSHQMLAQFFQAYESFGTGFSFHDCPAYSFEGVMWWGSGRFLFISIGKSASQNKQHAEVLYSNAVKYGLIDGSTGAYAFGDWNGDRTGSRVDPSKQIVCASAKIRIAGGSEFKRAKFTIGGTEPQEVRITQSAGNFAIKKEYGGLVYQRIDGKSWGSLTLEPGNYILSCNGGGAMGLMSATVCIEYPVIEGTPTGPGEEVPEVKHPPEPPEVPSGEEVKPSLPLGPIVKIVVRSADPNDDIEKDYLIMVIGEEKFFRAWGKDANSKEGPVTVDEWKLSDEDIGSIKDGLFKAGPKEGWVKIRATAEDLTGVFRIKVVAIPPIIVIGRLKLCNEYNNPFHPGGVRVRLSVRFFENREDLNAGSYVTWDDFYSRTDVTGRFKFMVPVSGEFARLYCDITPDPPSPAGYEWVHGAPPPQHCAGQSDESTWEGQIDASRTIHITPDKIFLDNEWPTSIQIQGEVTHHGKPVENAKVRLLYNGKCVMDTRSDFSGEFTLDVDSLSKGRYMLTAQYKPTIDLTKPPGPGNYVSVRNWLYIRKDILVDLPLPTDTKTIDIEMISFAEKIGYTGP